MQERQKREKRIWQRLAKNYDKQVKVYEQAYNISIQKILKFLNQDSEVLDIACGTGIVSLGLAKYVKQIIAIDLSEKMIKVAKNKTIEKKITNIEFKVADAYQLNYPENSFDIILLFNTLHIVQEPVSVLNKIYNLLKPSGKLIIATDCYAEPVSGGVKVQLGIQKVFNKIGLIPFLSFYKKSEIDTMIANCGYEIIEKDDLHKNPINYYLALKKKIVKN